MTRINWNKQLEIGNQKIDDQHQQLIDYLNNLNDAIESGSSTSSVFELLFNNLVYYSKYHFSDEEKLMAEINYPGLDHQRTEHEFFINKLAEMQNRFMADENIELVVLTFLGDWLVNHIVEEDKKIAAFIKASK